MEEENINTNPVPTTPVENQPVETPTETPSETPAPSENPVPTTPVENQPIETPTETPSETPAPSENPVPTTPAEGQPTAQTDSTTQTPTETPSETTTNATTSPSTNTSTDTTTNTSTDTKSPESTISNTATGPTGRTNAQNKMEIASDGTMSIDGKVATNEELAEYFDYTKYSDKNAAKMVEGIFKSDTVTINGVTYKAELNENGEMVSIDGTKKLTQEEIKSYLGEKGYEALVCKTTKDVSVDENGKISIKDRDEKVKITIAQPSKDIAPNAAINNASKDTTGGKDTQAKIKDPTGASSGGGGYSGGGGGGYSGGGGNYSGGSSGGSPGSSGGVNDEEVEEAGTPVIMVDFGSLGAIRDSIDSLKGQMESISSDYSGTINGIGGNSSAWSGSDKDTYVSQKKGYAANLDQVNKTLGEFSNYLNTCLTNYETMESELASKEIS